MAAASIWSLIEAQGSNFIIDLYKENLCAIGMKCLIFFIRFGHTCYRGDLATYRLLYLARPPPAGPFLAAEGGQKKVRVPL